MEKITRIPLWKWAILLIVGFITLTFVYGLCSATIMNPNLNPWIRIAMALVEAPIIGLAYVYLFEHWYKHWNPEPVQKKLQLQGIHPWMGKGLLVGFCYFMVLVLIMAAAGSYRIQSCQFDAPELLAWLLLFLVVGIGEECIFRGVLFRLIDERWGFWAALLVSSLFFGAVHWMNDNGTWWSSLAIAIEAGLLLGVAYKFSGNLWFPAGIHWAWNFTQGNILGFKVSGELSGPSLFTPTLSGSDLITGGAFGAEASVIAVILGFLISCWYIYRIRA